MSSAINESMKIEGFELGSMQMTAWPILFYILVNDVKVQD
jgi:hypothetical protein